MIFGTKHVNVTRLGRETDDKPSIVSRMAVKKKVRLIRTIPAETSSGGLKKKVDRMHRSLSPRVSCGIRSMMEHPFTFSLKIWGSATFSVQLTPTFTARGPTLHVTSQSKQIAFATCILLEVLCVKIHFGSVYVLLRYLQSKCNRKPLGVAGT